MSSLTPESIIEHFVQQKNSSLASVVNSLLDEAKKVVEILKQNNPDNFQKVYQAFLLQQIKLVVTNVDVRFVRVDFIIQLIHQQVPAQFPSIIQELLSNLVQAYQIANPAYFIKNLIFQIEQLLDLALAQQMLSDDILPPLQTITQLEIKERDTSELQYHHIIKVLEVLQVIKTPKSVELILELTQHPSWNVRNLANQLLEQSLDDLV
ncbi:hypothetical protein BKI52_21570 [marine bacterium AO1-C]|nr:hypothetical protein BKI52_21570 [marine bacterium AO1-C]